MPESKESNELLNENEKVKKNYTPSGRSGTLVTGFEVQDDYIKSLQGEHGQIIYERMSRSDSKIRQLVHAVNNPIKSANWTIEPASTEQKDIDAAALMEQILFNDMPEGWKSKLDEILTFPWHGHSVFEIVHKNFNKPPFGPYTGLANLAWRDQRTITQWHFTPAGVLEKIYQEQSGDIYVNEYIDADTLLIFFNEKKGNDTGYPFLRMLYGNYKRKLLYKELQAIGIERSAIPVPKLTLPEDVPHDSDEASNAETQLAAFVNAETAYFMLPKGYELELDATGTFDPQKVQTAIKAENEEISGSLVAMFLEMGIGGNSGNQAGTETSAKFFKKALVYLADKICEKINDRLIPNLMRLNFGETYESLPKLKHSGITESEGEALMKIVTGYVKDGVITPDEGLEDHVRKQHNLPSKDEGEMLDNGEAQGAENENDRSQDDNNNSDDDNNTNAPSGQPTELNLSSKKIKNAEQLMKRQEEVIQKSIKDALSFSGAKYVNDVMRRYNQLSPEKKQRATDKIKMGGNAAFRKQLKRDLTETSFQGLNQAKSEIPSMRNVDLSSTEEDIIRLNLQDTTTNLNEFSDLPPHVQLLIAKQSDLISKTSLDELQKQIDFKLSSIDTKTNDPAIVQQNLEEASNEFIESNNVRVKAANVTALMVNESRNSFFFNDNVLDEIHSFTFVNPSPVAPVCKELAGRVIAPNDAESLRYSPPLHHNCKSYLRANLKSSRGTDRLEITSWSPSAEAKKSISL